MNEMKVFENADFGKVRTIVQDGEPWFVAADVCRALEIVNVPDAVARLDEDEKNTIALTDGIPGNPNKTIVNEPGLYALVLSSRKPEAKVFKRWIIHEVIPAIRKTGGYIVGEEKMTDDELMARALEVAQKKLAEREARIAHLTADNQKMLPKAEYFDELVERNLLTSFRTTAKELKIKERVFIDFLMERKFIYRDKSGKLAPYAQKNDGLFEIKECASDKTGWAGTQTLVTPKGRETFRLLMQGLRNGGADDES